MEPDDDGEAEFDDVFGGSFAQREGHFSRGFRQDVRCIMTNDPDGRKEFGLWRHTTAETKISNAAWGLLGRYISNNTHLETINFECCNFGDDDLCPFFDELKGSVSLKQLNLTENKFGVDCIRSMVPFLKNSPNLTYLSVDSNVIRSRGFEILLEALQSSSIEELNCGGCHINDIDSLENSHPPNLKRLLLHVNDIEHISINSLEKLVTLTKLELGYNGEEIDVGERWRYTGIKESGCRAIARLLQNKKSSLQELYLYQNDIGDNEAKIIASSLQHNTTLRVLDLETTNIEEEGLRAFLKLLNDISSIGKTYTSNHTLVEVGLPFYSGDQIYCSKMLQYIELAIKINKNSEGYSHDAGRVKVAITQLTSTVRKTLCDLQCIDYSDNSVIAKIDSVLLPNILSTVGAEGVGYDELFLMLRTAAPDLTSLINKKAVLKEGLAEKITRMAAINAKYNQQVAALTAEKTKQLAALDAENLEMIRGAERGANLSSSGKLCGKKRGRSASF